MLFVKILGTHKTNQNHVHTLLLSDHVLSVARARTHTHKCATRVDIFGGFRHFTAHILIKISKTIFD